MIENFHLVLNVIVYFLNFSGSICLMLVITINVKYFNMIDQLISNWSTGIIKDVKIIENLKADNEIICPENYEYLFSYYWPGTKSGCNCLNISNLTNYPEFEKKLVIGSCSNTLDNLGCKTIPELQSKVIHSLGDKYYCSKRSRFNYISNYTQNIYEYTCPDEMKNCGKIDSLENILCVNKNEECPISDYNNTYKKAYIYSNPYLNADSQSKSIEVYSFNKLPDLVKFYSNYFIQFKVSQGNVCINNDEINLYNEDISELYNDRKRIKCNTVLGNNTKFDGRYTTVIISQTEIVFYKEEILKLKIQELPNFENLFYQPIQISGRKYIGWSKRCKNKIESFIDSYKVVTNIHKYSWFYLIYSLITLIYCMLFIMILKELMFNQYGLKIFIILIHVLMIFNLFLMILKDYSNLSLVIDIYYSIIKKNCSDSETNYLIIKVFNSFKEISNLYFITMVLYVVIMQISIFKMLLTFYKLYKRHIFERIMRGNVNHFEMILLM